MHIPRRPVRTILSAGIGVFLSLTAAVAAPPLELPPLSSLHAGEHHAGKMIWADLVIPDLGTAERFYGGLFGWTFRDIHGGATDYAVATLNGRPVAGLVQRAVPAGEPKQPAWLTFLAVRDVDAAIRLARSGGATVLGEPRTYRGRGRQAVLSDPEGAVFAVLASASGDPGDFLAAPGEWIWTSLLATDPGAAAAFYKKVFGYDVFELPQVGTSQHFVLSSNDYARAGVNSLPQDSKRRHAHWLNFVRVADAGEAVAKAVSLGGRALVDPYVDRHGGRIAVLADPAGAPFGVMEWASTDSKVEPK
jgi:predicted enzyme related to lactoylglutathione lyase